MERPAESARRKVQANTTVLHLCENARAEEVNQRAHFGGRVFTGWPQHMEHITVAGIVTEHFTERALRQGITHREIGEHGNA